MSEDLLKEMTAYQYITHPLLTKPHQHIPKKEVLPKHSRKCSIDLYVLAIFRYDADAVDRTVSV